MQVSQPHTLQLKVSISFYCNEFFENLKPANLTKTTYYNLFTFLFHLLKTQQALLISLTKQPFTSHLKFFTSEVSNTTILGFIFL